MEGDTWRERPELVSRRPFIFHHDNTDSMLPWWPGKSSYSLAGKFQFIHRIRQTLHRWMSVYFGLYRILLLYLRHWKTQNMTFSSVFFQHKCAEHRRVFWHHGEVQWWVARSPIPRFYCIKREKMYTTVVYLYIEYLLGKLTYINSQSSQQSSDAGTITINPFSDSHKYSQKLNLREFDSL